MSEEDIRNKAILGFDFNTSVTELVVPNGDSEKTVKKIKVDVKELNPEELMDKLSFTDEQKNWARTLYASIADSQTIKPGDPDYIYTTGTDYGNIRFVEGQTEVVYYNQGDSRWGNRLYG